MPHPDDIERKLPRWTALADLFLDTEIDDATRQAIARAVRASDLDIPSVEAILKDEVLPAFAFNLMQVSGEWAGWDEAQVREIMLRSLVRKPGLVRRIKQTLLWPDIRKEWKRIVELIA